MTSGIRKENAIDLADVRFSYSGKKEDTILAIDQLQIVRGEQIFLFGSSGSGKSTLLNLLGGIMRPYAGQINVLGSELTNMSSLRRDRFRAKHVGIVFQQFNLIPYLSILENIRLAHHFSKKNVGSVVQKAQDLFARLQLDISLLKRRADLLSVGQQQRVAIARALVNDPEIIIADEPSSALDSDARNNFMKLLLEVVRFNRSTLIFVSHDRSLAQYFQKTIDLALINRINKKPDVI